MIFFKEKIKRGKNFIYLPILQLYSQLKNRKDGKSKSILGKTEIISNIKSGQPV